MKLIIHFVRVIALVQGTVANLSKTIPVARAWPLILDSQNVYGTRELPKTEPVGNV